MKDFDLRKYLAEGKLLKEDQMMGKYIQTKHPDGYDMIMSFSMPDEEELGLDWWYKKHDFDINLVNRPMKTFKENFIEINTPSPDTIQPWDDIVKYAAADVFTTTPILDNTGVMGFSRNTFKDLNIIINKYNKKMNMK